MVPESYEVGKQFDRQERLGVAVVDRGVVSLLDDAGLLQDSR